MFVCNGCKAIQETKQVVLIGMHWFQTKVCLKMSERKIIDTDKHTNTRTGKDWQRHVHLLIQNLQCLLNKQLLF